MNKLSFTQKVGIFIVSTSVLVIGLLLGLFFQIREFYSTAEYYSRANKLEELNARIKKNPNDAASYAKRGKLRYYDEAYDKALNDYDDAILLDPKNAEWYQERAKIWSRKDDHKKAIADLTKSIELKPNEDSLFARGEEYRETHEPLKALADFDRALELGYKPRVQALVEKAGVFKDNGDIDKAIDVYNVAVKEKFEPFTSDDAFEELSKLKIAKGDFAGAMSVLDQFVQKAPDDDDAYERRAVLHTALAQNDQASDDYKSVAKCITHDIAEYDPQKDGYYFQRRGEAWKKAGKEKEAVADFKKALELYKNASERNDRSIAELFELLGDKSAASKVRLEQIKVFTVKISKDPEDADLFHDRAGLYDDNGSLEAAYKDYSQALKLDPKSSDYKGHVAQALLEKKQYDAATVLLRELLKDDLKVSSSWCNLAEILGLAGHQDEALDAANKAIALDATNASAYYFKHKVLKSKGDEKAARICYQQAIALGYEEDADTQ
ncbi:MAG: tetratricopeptide repeat protein [Candidatus Melainabacteria bacterium]|nr:tetratricopeptide repeat protein [Candidatus Melainabacteria bacterium]